MKRLFVCVVISFFTTSLFCQKPILINLKDGKATQEIAVKDGVIALSSLPDTLVLIFPDKNFINYGISFNSDSTLTNNTVQLNFNCESEDTCLQLLLSDIIDNRLTLSFNNNKIVAIGRRSVTPKTVGNFLSIIKPVIKDQVAKLDMYDSLKAPDGVTQEVLIVQNVDAYKIQFDCNFSNKITQSEKSTNKKNVADTDKIYSPFNQLFYKPIVINHSSHAITPKYRGIYDTRTNEVTYLKYKNKKDFEYYKVKKFIAPMANREILFSVIGSIDSTYIIDSSSVQYFMEYGKGFNDQIASIDVNPKTDKSNPDNNTAKTPQDSLFLLEKNKNTNSGTCPSKNQIQCLINEYVDTTKTDKKLKLLIDNACLDISTNAKKNILNKNISKTFFALADKYVDALRELTQSQGDNASLRVTIDSLIRKIDTLKNQLVKVPNSEEWKNLLMSLDISLEEFNLKYANIDFMEKQYASDLLCLKLKVKQLLGITVPDEEKAFAQLLINLVKPKIADMYYTDFANLIHSIEAEYKKASNKQPKYKIYSKSIQIPNADELAISIKTKNGSDYLLNRTFNISRGFKIDFSTGVFLTGISNSDFVVAPQSYRYRATKDTVVIRGGAGIDSVINKGIQDTVGSSIYENKKLTFSTGFMLHAYTRTGSAVNLGIAAGAIIDNNSNAQILLGGSLLLHAGKSRVVLSGGLAIGRQKILSKELEQYKVPPSTLPVYNTRYDLPKFYTGTNPTTAFSSTTSWFFGLTYNFASINVK